MATLGITILSMMVKSAIIPKTHGLNVEVVFIIQCNSPCVKSVALSELGPDGSVDWS